ADAGAARDVRPAPHPRKRPRAETPTASRALTRGPLKPPPASALAKAPVDARATIVFDDDTRRLVTDTTAWPYRAVVWLGMTWPNGTGGGCSGTLVCARSVLTAGHCIYDAGRGW